MQDGERVMQCNEGKWAHQMLESSDKASLILEVDVGSHIDTSLIRADVQPLLVRVLVKVPVGTHLSAGMYSCSAWSCLVHMLAQL